MKAFRLDIQTENAAFDDAVLTETARILRELSHRFESPDFDPLENSRGAYGFLFDANGKNVGQWQFDER